MFGSFRLLLAIGVVLSHMGVSVGGVNTGIVGVVCFFMVSGFAMSGLVSSSYARMPEDIPGFYLDRFVRLAPQYYFYLAICAFTVLVLGWRETGAQSGGPDATSIMANLTVVPLAFWMFNGSIGTFMLNIPTWSLGTEVCFYIILPFLLFNRVILWGAAAIGAATWAISTHGLIHPDFYAYRLLPGTLVFFLVGVALQRGDWKLYAALVAFFMGSAISLQLGHKIWLQFNVQLLIGATVGCIAVPILGALGRNRLDDRIGAASYGCFLAHWIFVTALKQHYGEPWAVLTAIVGSVLCGWASYKWIEAPTVRFRHEIRRRKGKLRPEPSDAVPATSGLA